MTLRRIIEGIRIKNLEAILFSKALNSIHEEKMKLLLRAYCLPKETVTSMMKFDKNTKAIIHSPDGDTNFFDLVAGVLQGDTLALYLFIICLASVLRITSH